MNVKNKIVEMKVNICFLLNLTKYNFILYSSKKNEKNV